MTPKERAAMQQALELLWKCGPLFSAAEDKAITALREALAEQAEQEPVKRFTSDDVKVAFENGYAAAMSVADIAKEVEQEPVAEVVLHSYKVGFGRTEERKDIVFLADVEVGTKLYTAPVRTKDLTDDEIVEALGYDKSYRLKRWVLDDARAVIAAHKEKNR